MIGECLDVCIGLLRDALLHDMKGVFLITYDLRLDCVFRLPA